MFKSCGSIVSLGFLLLTIVTSVRTDEIRFLHYFDSMEPDLALGDPNPVAETALIVDDGWNFYGGAPGSGLEVVNGARLDFNAADNVDWNLGSLEFWFMSYNDMDDSANHKLFCTPIGHDNPMAIHIWKTAMFNDLRFRLRDDANLMTEAVWAGASEWKAEEWHHIAVSWDNEVGLNLYADGESVAASTAQWECDPGFETFSVGGQGGSSTTNGVIDELAIYDYVISEEYVKERFSAAKPLGTGMAVESGNKLVTMWGRLKNQ